MDHKYKAVQFCCPTCISEFLILYDLWPRITPLVAAVGGVGDKKVTSKRDVRYHQLD